MKKILTQLQDAAYELEGLLMLSLSREDRQESLSPLVLEKISAITKLGDELRMQLISRPDVEVVSDEEINSPCAKDDETDKSVATDQPELLYDEEKQAGETIFTPESLPDAFTETAPAPKNDNDKVKRTSRRPVFCINDRFLFIRELFGNSSAAFDRAMDKVATMDSIEEAENYFISESGWNPENENVMRFMETLENYFERD